MYTKRRYASNIGGASQSRCDGHGIASVLLRCHGSVETRRRPHVRAALRGTPHKTGGFVNDRRERRHRCLRGSGRVVKIISGGKEYEPRIDGLNGLADGIHYDAIIMQPDGIADLLVPIPLCDDFQIVIDGGIRLGGIAFEL